MTLIEHTRHVIYSIHRLLIELHFLSLHWRMQTIVFLYKEFSASKSYSVMLHDCSFDIE